MRSGWRSIVWFGEFWTEHDAPYHYGNTPLPVGERLLWGCELTLDPPDEIPPGRNGRGRMMLFALEERRPEMHPGAGFELHEGLRKIGDGTVLSTAET